MIIHHVNFSGLPSEKSGRPNDTTSASDVANEDGPAIIDNLSFLKQRSYHSLSRIILKSLACSQYVISS
jgi:hypothetical protein